MPHRVDIRALLPPIAAFLGPVALLLPFLNKAFHMDDPLSLWTARHILADPLRFFDYTVNWTGIEAPAYLIIKNPPLAMYYLALAGAVFGWSEPAMHGAYLLPAGLTGLGTYYVARHLCSRPLLATASAMLTPAILVSASNVMTTIVMVAFYVWAIATWLWALERDRTPLYFVSGALIAASSLAKYFGISAVPLLLAYMLLKRRWYGWWMAALLVPAAVMIVYDRTTHALFGIGLLLEAGRFADIVQAEQPLPKIYGVLIGLAFTGGAAPTVFCYAARFGWRWLAGMTCAILVCVGLAWWLRAPLLTPAAASPYNLPAWAGALEFGVYAAAGALALALAAADVWRTRTPESGLLLLWVFGTVAFAAVVNWTVNARSVMPLAPALGILIARWLDRSPVAERRPWMDWAPLLPIAALSCVLVYADFSLANAGRRAARHFQEEMPPVSGSTYYFGHWGFQYYMDLGPAKPFDVGGTRVEPGDVIILPDNNVRNFQVPDIYDQRYTVAFDVLPWATTWNYHLGAAFYSSTWGTLPYAFGRVPDEHYVALLVSRAAHLENPAIEEVRRTGQLPEPR